MQTECSVPEGWNWDSTLFKGSAAYYSRGRMPYAPGFAEVLAEALALDGRGVLLDVGCGPGTVILQLASYFEEAVGMDPDEDMLAEARRRAGELGVGNVRWIQAMAEDLPLGLGPIRVAMFAQSFHWTDRDKVASAVFDMLIPGGKFVHMSDRKGPLVNPLQLPHPAPPVADIEELAAQYLGNERRAGQGVLRKGTPNQEDVVLARAGFTNKERLIVPGNVVIDRSPDDIVAWTFSVSKTAPHLFGSRVEDFERDLRTLLHRTSPEDVFSEQVRDTEIWIWTKPAES
jgi:SAM-dependent methyltransferase